ncbi:hypothetical protein MHYP_G00226020 [Metynnis hypsauchen]
MPFGLFNAPATFQRLVDRVLAGLQWEMCLVYLDDIIVLGKDVSEMLQHLSQVFDRLLQANLKLKPSKCCLFRRQVAYLGHIVSAQGIATDPEKVQKVQQWPEPTCVSEVRQFVGLAAYYQRFVPNFAAIAKPLHELTKKNAHFRWTPECQDAFETLKSSLTTIPVLGYPRDSGDLILDTDATNLGIGAVLSQMQDGAERVLAYGSQQLSSTEQNYCTTRRELLAVVEFTRHFRQYLLGRPFIVRSDHSSLRWLVKMKEPEGQLARWLEKLAEYDFKVVHRPGHHHHNADVMSRRPCRQTCPCNMTDPAEGNGKTHHQGGQCNLELHSDVTSLELRVVEALIEEFSNHLAQTGLVAALAVKQHRRESAQQYYSRLRLVYFGSRNEPGMEEDLHFKTLFVRNLHPTTSHYLGIAACPQTLSSRQLRDLALKGFAKHLQASNKRKEVPNVINLDTQGSSLNLSQRHRTPKVQELSRPQHSHCDRYHSRPLWADKSQSHLDLVSNQALPRYRNKVPPNGRSKQQTCKRGKNNRRPHQTIHPGGEHKSSPPCHNSEGAGRLTHRYQHKSGNPEVESNTLNQNQKKKFYCHCQ